MDAVEIVKKRLAYARENHLDAVMVNFFMPCELFYAMGLPVMCAEAESVFAIESHDEKRLMERAESEGISDTLCGYHRVLMGEALANEMPVPAYLVHTGLACDANQVTYRWLAHRIGAAHYSIDIPYRKNDQFVDYVAAQLKEMAEMLEEMTGNQLSMDILKQTVQRSRETVRLMNEVWRTGAHRVDLRHAMAEAYLMNVGLGSTKALHYAQYLKEQVWTAVPASKRYIWLSTAPIRPLPYFDTYLTGFELRDSDVIEETDPYRYMAMRMTSHYYNGSTQDRIDHALEMAQAMDATGVIMYCHWGCKMSAGASILIKKALEEKGYPTLILNGDAVDETNAADGQTATRIHAFLEMGDHR